MTNIQLYVEKQLVDYGDSMFALQKEFEDLDKNIQEPVEYSYSISIPTSFQNRKVFGFANAFDAPNKFSRVYDAELYADEMLILKGKLRLTEIDGEVFKGNLYTPKQQTVSDILGDRALNEILPHYKPMNGLEDFTAQNNYVLGMSGSTVIWPDEEFRDRHICYPYVLYQLPMNDPLQATTDNLNFYTQKLNYGYHTIDMDKVYPAFNVCSVIKDMFATEGYEVTGNVFEDKKFKDLYQTYQGTYSDYLSSREVPYHVLFDCYYTNYEPSTDNISKTLEIATLWSENDDTYPGSGEWDGQFRYGVDSPLQAGENTKINIYANDYGMLTKGSESDGYSLLVPQDGWYRIQCFGFVTYPDGSDTVHSSDATESVGGYRSQNDDTSLSQMPLEFQIKKGYPMENPRLYSFNSWIPCMPTHFSEKTSVVYKDYNAYIKVMDNDRSKYYAKNGKEALIKEYSDFPTADLIGGARFGGAWFSGKWPMGGKGMPPRPDRWATKGAGLALPKATNASIRDFDDDAQDHDYYFQINAKSGNTAYEYAGETAQILIKEDSYSNFAGYNKVNWTGGTWDTTTNYYSRTYPGAVSSTASTIGENNGHFEINTVVYLQKGDVLNFELLMPVHTYSAWIDRLLPKNNHYQIVNEAVNHTTAKFTFSMGLVNKNKDWIPTSSDPIPTWDQIFSKKVTNVNKLLPNIKCNDYLNNFLKTFNLQLTHPSANSFEINYAQTNEDGRGDIIDIEQYVNVKDAKFKAIDSPSTRQLSWKNDLAETGYKDGNQSPYRNAAQPWQNSGYTGNISITNEANTSGSIEKTESQWSYNWYKGIRFTGGLGLSIATAQIPVITDSSVWDSETTYLQQASETPQTNKTTRLFFLSKNQLTGMYEWIDFPYTDRGDVARLLIPSNHIKGNGGSELYLDYDSDSVHAYNHNYKTLTDMYFNLKVQGGYEIELPVKLPNEIYKRITASSLIKINDGLYKVKEIEGHDVEMKDEAKLTLLTLK